jgi:hypothetical protein
MAALPLDGLSSPLGKRGLCSLEEKRHRAPFAFGRWLFQRTATKGEGKGIGQRNATGRARDRRETPSLRRGKDEAKREGECRK